MLYDNLKHAVGDLKNDFNVEHEFKPFKFELKCVTLENEIINH